MLNCISLSEKIAYEYSYTNLTSVWVQCKWQLRFLFKDDITVVWSKRTVLLLSRLVWPTFLRLAQEENLHQTLVHLHLKKPPKPQTPPPPWTPPPISGPQAQPHHFQVLPQSKSNLIPFHNNLWWKKLEIIHQSTRTSGWQELKDCFYHQNQNDWKVCLVFLWILPAA